MFDDRPPLFMWSARSFMNWVWVTNSQFCMCKPVTYHQIVVSKYRGHGSFTYIINYWLQLKEVIAETCSGAKLGSMALMPRKGTSWWALRKKICRSVWEWLLLTTQGSILWCLKIFAKERILLLLNIACRQVFRKGEKKTLHSLREYHKNSV